jgi:TIR domain
VPRDQVFISYSHKDKKWCDDLDTHLKPYLRDGSITSWSDRQIAPGSEWFKEIQSALANSKVAVLLVSPDFLASDFIHEHELTPLLKKAEQGGVQILWIPVRSSSYEQTALKNYQAILDPSKPLAEISKAKRDRAWVQICQRIQKAVGRTDEPRQSPNLEQSNLSAQPATAGGGPATSPVASGSPSKSPAPALEWEDHLGHIYEGETVIYTKGVTLSAKNVSNRPVQLEQAHFKSAITDKTAEAKVHTPEGFLDPSETTPIPPDGSVTLRAEFNLPSGLPAQEFIKIWGKMVLYVTYDGIAQEVSIGEDVTRALYVNFRPNLLAPTVTRVGPPQRNMSGATEPRSALRPAEFSQSDFLQIATRLSQQVDGSYLQRCHWEVQQGVLEAECGATFALTMGDGSNQETIALISNGIKKFRLNLSEDVKQMTFSLAHIAEGSDSDQMEALRNIVRGLVPSVLCGWILVHALRVKDVPLLKAAHALGIDSLAIDSFSLPIPRKEKLEDLPEALRRLFDEPQRRDDVR